MSFILHCAAIALIIYLPWIIPVSDPVLDAAPEKLDMIYYWPVPKKLPLPSGRAGGRTGAPAPASAAAAAAPPETKPVVHPKIPNPVVARETAPRISPSDLLMRGDVPLPELKPLDIPKPQLVINAGASVPLRKVHQKDAGAAPSVVSSADSGSSAMSFLTPSAGPSLTMSVSGSAGVAATRTVGTANGTRSIDAPSIGQGAAAGNSGNVLAYVVDPSAPPGPGGPGGNGKGGFSVSSSASSGMPGAGNGAGGVGGGSLTSETIMSMVFPVPASFTVRQNTLIVASGPLGGGGLAVYKVLNCEKIYTIFLNMPGKSWTMQYCPEVDSGSQTTIESGTTVVHLTQAVLPPQPESRFDFKRLAIPSDKARQTLIIKGLLREDGTLENLSVFQGIQPQMDEAARVALSRWKFRPALRDNKPVAVRILVGIPMDAVSPAP